MFIEFYIVEYYKYLIFFFFFNKYTLSNNKRCINLDTINLSISQYPIKRLLNCGKFKHFSKIFPRIIRGRRNTRFIITIISHIRSDDSLSSKFRALLCTIWFLCFSQNHPIFRPCYEYYFSPVSSISGH